MEQIKKVSINDTEYQIVDETALHEGDMPEVLPNPNKLTFTGAVTGEYDGSEAITLNIPTVAGADGVSVTHSWNGTTLSVTSASGTSSADLKGEDGADGRGITSVARTSGNGSAGITDTYTITYTDNTTSTFTVYNGKDGVKGDKGDTGAAGKTSYQYAQEGGYEGTEKEFSALLANTVDKRKITLGLHTDGLIYLFIDGAPVGNGIALPSGGVSGDVVGNVDSANNIVLMGNLADGTYTVKYEMEDGSTVNIGTMVLDSNVYYSVTKNLTNCTISNSATQAIGGNSYSATISANDGYELKSVTVTMGGSAVSVTDGVINIASVTGNIVITAVAEVSGPAYTNRIPLSKDASGNAFNGGQGWKTGYRLGGDGTEKALSGIEVTGFIPIVYGDTIYMKNITDDGTHVMGVYNSSHSKIGTRTFTNIFGGAVSGQVLSMVVNNKWATETGGTSGVAYLRVSATEITADSIITVNEPIV